MMGLPEVWRRDVSRRHWLRGAGGPQMEGGPEGILTEGDDGLGAVLVSDQAHYCVDRAVRIMDRAEGVGLVATDARHKITAEGLMEALRDMEAKGRQVVSQCLHHKQWSL